MFFIIPYISELPLCYPCPRLFVKCCLLEIHNNSNESVKVNVDIKYIVLVLFTECVKYMIRDQHVIIAIIQLY